MNFTIPKSTFLGALQRVQNVVGLRSPLPILSNVCIKADETGLHLGTTDLEVSVKCSVEAKVENGGGSTLPVRRLSSIIKELPERDVSVEIDDGDKATIKCGSSYFKIVGMPDDDFPPIAQAEGDFSYHLDQGAFREMLRKTSYAASSDETRQVLNGVLLSFKGTKLTMVATDGRRLALVEHEVEFPEEAEADVILPTKAVHELLHTLGDDGDLKISVGDSQIAFEFGNVLVFSKLIDGTYPNFRQVIPADCEERVTIERESLLTSLKRVSLLTTDSSSATKLAFGNNQLVVSTNSPDVGEARETIPIKYSGSEIVVAFNAEFMMDGLRCLGNDEIFVELTDELSPGVIKCDIPFLYVLMPMRVNE